eukprot:4282158-Amphidinium_carterae.2
MSLRSASAGILELDRNGSVTGTLEQLKDMFSHVLFERRSSQSGQLAQQEGHVHCNASHVVKVFRPERRGAMQLQCYFVRRFARPGRILGGVGGRPTISRTS